MESRGRIMAVVVVLLSAGLVGLSLAMAWARLFPQVPPDMARVPAGPFTSGVVGETVTLPEYYIDVYEVTNHQFATFVGAADYKPRGDWQVYARHNGGDRPVVGVTVSDALAYARFYDRRLPTALEWEKACRGTDGRPYPWGAEWKPGKANVQTADIAPVGQFAEDVSVYGVHDLAGNVLEWTGTMLDDGKPLGVSRAIMGGCWAFWAMPGHQLRGHEAGSPSHVIGFRCVWPR